jgi:hypothetical protein
MNFSINPNNKKTTCSLLSIFIASALIFTPLTISNSASAQPFSFNKISQESKAEKCASHTLPISACKNVANLGQANSGGGIGTGQTAAESGGGGGTATTGGSGNGTGLAGATGGSNTANSAISQGQQNTQSCASGNLKLLPHSSMTCSNTANLGQANSGNISTGQTAAGGSGGGSGTANP